MQAEDSTLKLGDGLSWGFLAEVRTVPATSSIIAFETAVGWSMFMPQVSLGGKHVLSHQCMGNRVDRPLIV